MSTQGLVNVANQLAHRLDESPRVRPLKLLIFNSYITQKNQFLLLFAKSQNTGRDCHKLNHFTCPQHSTQPFQVLLISTEGPLRKYRGSSQPSLLIGFTYLFSKLGTNLPVSLMTPELHSQCSKPQL